MLPYTSTIPLRRAALQQTRLTPFNLTLRPFTTTPMTRSNDKPKPPPTNIPPSAQKANKTSSPAHDEQSSASTVGNTSSDDHPAKQPDPQHEVDRSTGFGNVKGPVQGGKEGLGHRSDRDADGK